MFGIAKPIAANMNLPMLCRCTLKICLLLVGFLGIESMEDNILSYKSSVLGSLNSGQQVTGRVFSSSCHNYFINVTSVGYNLVVDLDSSSTKLFLLVKASPILRHSLEDEHNYASYYQFKKQGDHHGVVVTSEHLSPGRWYIGVCNYVQDSPFSEKGSNALLENERRIDAEYRVTATLRRTKKGEACKDPACKISSAQHAREAALEECGEEDLCRWKISASPEPGTGLESQGKLVAREALTPKGYPRAHDASEAADKPRKNKADLSDLGMPSASKEQMAEYPRQEIPSHEICGNEISSICKVCSETTAEKSTAGKPSPCSRGMSFQMSFILGFATSFMLITACVVFAPRFPSHVNPAFKAFNILYTLAKADGNDEKIAGKEPREDLKAMQIQDLEARNSALEAKLQHEKAAVENLQRLLEEMRQRNDQSRMERDQSARDLTSQVG